MGEYNLYSLWAPATIRKTAMKYLEKFKKPESGDIRNAYGVERQRRRPIATRRTPQISFARPR